MEEQVDDFERRFNIIVRFFNLFVFGNGKYYLVPSFWVLLNLGTFLGDIFSGGLFSFTALLYYLALFLELTVNLYFGYKCCQTKQFATLMVYFKEKYGLDVSRTLRYLDYCSAILFLTVTMLIALSIAAYSLGEVDGNANITDRILQSISTIVLTITVYGGSLYLCMLWCLEIWIIYYCTKHYIMNLIHVDIQGDVSVSVGEHSFVITTRPSETSTTNGPGPVFYDPETCFSNNSNLSFSSQQQSPVMMIPLQVAFQQNAIKTKINNKTNNTNNNYINNNNNNNVNNNPLLAASSLCNNNLHNNHNHHSNSFDRSQSTSTISFTYNQQELELQLFTFLHEMHTLSNEWLWNHLIRAITGLIIAGYLLITFYVTIIEKTSLFESVTYGYIVIVYYIMIWVTAVVAGVANDTFFKHVLRKYSILYAKLGTPNSAVDRQLTQTMTKLLAIRGLDGVHFAGLVMSVEKALSIGSIIASVAFFSMRAFLTA